MPARNERTLATYGKWLRGLAASEPEGSSAEVDALLEEARALGREDLHFFSVVACGKEALTGPEELHGRVCRFLGERPGPKRRWLETWRGSLKSTIGSICMPLWDVVKDPQERYLIVSGVQPLSRSFVSAIMLIVDEGATFRRLYPEVRGSRKQWSGDEARVQGAMGTEPTWKAGSVKKGLTGGHHTKIVADDLVCEENVGTRKQALTVIERWRSWRPNVDKMDSLEFQYGTPYTFYDLYAWQKREMPKVFTRLVTPPVDLEGRLVWPEEFDHPRLDELKITMGLERYSSQYMLDPLPPHLQIFREGQFRYWRRPEENVTKGVWDGILLTIPHPERLTVYLGGDPGTGTEEGDPSALVAVGIDKQNRLYALEVAHGQFDAGEYVDMTLDMMRRLRAERGWIEMAGPFVSLAALYAAEMEARKEWVMLERAEGTNEPKPKRIRTTLLPLYQNARMFHAQHLRGTELEEQLVHFPKGLHDDILDALTNAVRVALKYGFYPQVSEDTKRLQARSRFGFMGQIGYTMEEIEQLAPNPLKSYPVGSGDRGKISAF